MSEHEEYRVVGVRPDGSRWEGSPQRCRDGWERSARNEAYDLSRRNTDVEIQVRTVTVTPWREVARDASK